jgi:hypothetical protein
MKTCGGVKVWLQHSWPRHYMEVSGQLHSSAALLPGKEPPYPLDRRLRGLQSLYGRYGEEKLLPMPGI